MIPSALIPEDSTTFEKRLGKRTRGLEREDIVLFFHRKNGPTLRQNKRVNGAIMSRLSNRSRTPP